jgi:hypothetical protein
MKHQILFQQAINIGIILFLLAGCTSSTAPITASSTSIPLPTNPMPSLEPTSTTPPEPTSTTPPEPTLPSEPQTPTESPAFIQTAKGGESLRLAAPMLAMILPLPGEYLGLVKRGQSTIGISLGSGQDHTSEIRTSSTTLSQQPSDIFTTWGDPSPYFGVAKFEQDVQVPVFLDVSTGEATTGWNEAFLSAVKSGRTIMLKGTLHMPIVDPGSTNVLYALQYEFGDNSSISWDQNSQSLVWSNMKITKLPAP